MEKKLKKCMITRYDETINKAPYLTIQIDDMEVEKPANDIGGVEFAKILIRTCKLKGYNFRFYTNCSDSIEYDYEVVVF